MSIIHFAQGGITVNPTPPPGAEKFLALINIFGWFVTVAGVAALLLAGAMFGYEKWYSSGDAQAPKRVVAAIVGGVIASVAGPLMAFAVG
ncbi:MAG: hypothetical protein Q4B12_06595 [Bowdeniella nasicola]|nr:hypothetical protein [Bowdeniella nasicola]